MRARPFETLVSSGAQVLVASHLPTVLEDEGSTTKRLEAALKRIEGAAGDP